MKRWSFSNLILVLGLLFIYLPMVILVIYSFNASRLVTVWGGWSLKWYTGLLDNSQLMGAVMRSLEVAAYTAVAAVALEPPMWGGVSNLAGVADATQHGAELAHHDGVVGSAGQFPSGSSVERGVQGAAQTDFTETTGQVHPGSAAEFTSTRLGQRAVIQAQALLEVEASLQATAEVLGATHAPTAGAVVHGASAGQSRGLVGHLGQGSVSHAVQGHGRLGEGSGGSQGCQGNQGLFHVESSPRLIKRLRV